jgi:hypothetical protein
VPKSFILGAVVIQFRLSDLSQVEFETRLAIWVWSIATITRKFRANFARKFPAKTKFLLLRVAIVFASIATFARNFRAKFSYETCRLNEKV